MPEKLVLLAHGSGGELTRKLIEEIIVPSLHDGNEAPDLEDAALIDPPSGKLFFTTDSYVIDPFIFPGGDIGSLAVHGTVNDLAMRGAMPVALSVGLILEEGLPVDDLKTVMRSMGDAAKSAGVKIVCGDTKVAPKGFADKIFINTAGVGVADGQLDINSRSAKPGDVVIVNGTIGDHGAAVMLAREELDFSAPVQSDSAALHKIVQDLIDNEIEMHTMRDPTRGGLATAIVEIAESSQVSIKLDERLVPISNPVAAVCEILGLDPMYVANEGKMIVIVPERDADKAVSIMKTHKQGKEAAIIGAVTDGQPGGKVAIQSSVGGSRIVTALEGELLPRIC